MSRWSAGPVPFLMPGVFLERLHPYSAEPSLHSRGECKLLSPRHAGRGAVQFFGQLAAELGAGQEHGLASSRIRTSSSR